MKNIYFVRHGQTDGNAERVYRGPRAQLTEKGMQQAEAVAERFTKIPVDAIVTSSFERAIKTGEAIARHTQKPGVDSLDMFVEYEHPPEVEGLHSSDEKYQEILRIAREKFITRNERYSTEETFPELRKRASEAVEYLKNRPEENIVVVSHGKFIRFFIFYATIGNLLTPELFNALDRGFRSYNTGITRIVLGDDGRWMVWQWNDSAHLG